ncbi:ATP-binding protein [Pelobacter propionicus]|uniref:AAA ATPase n=1 Tax=Pelobacter propionicus (strain DSM 2379 / NBRC 103807 / OttBd1) TaxID=338966 RepID=A1ASH4_PELPD|nr:ATP-binding protein [Pelobacter propionicus]ABL00295.1 AAA ATPase [Pelobacter propionicus DSM 2379]
MEELGKRLVVEGKISEQQLEQALERQKLHGGRIGQNLVALGFLTPEALESYFKKHPAPPVTVDDTEIDVSLLTDLIMKHILFMGEFRLADVAEKVKLPIKIVDAIMETLRRDKFVEVKGGAGYATVTYTFKITDTGKNRSTELFELCRYVGPAPVSLESYRRMIEHQSIKNIIISEENIDKAFAHMVIDESILKRLGPAICSGKSVFIYGPPGNGKTAIAESIGKILPNEVYIPYAITVGGQIINVYDPVNHVAVPPAVDAGFYDQRWVPIKRPVVMTGGELTLKMLDLDFNEVSKFYEAPLQMKANNGLFVMDDLGRQQIEPHQLLNRWIVPLDRRIDFISLNTGMKFQIPFDVLVVFSTNLEPAELIDDALLRRLRYKIKIDHPTEIQFESIFRRICAKYGVIFDREAFSFLVQECYVKNSVRFNACHPRDIVEHIVDIAHFYNCPPAMTRETVRAAWSNYFVDSRR